MSPTQLLDHIGREQVRITHVQVTPLSYKPSDGSYIHLCGPVVLTKMDAGLVEVFTDQGIMGIGPSLGVHETDYSHLVGEDVFDVDRLKLPAGVDVACWDVIGEMDCLCNELQLLPYASKSTP